MKHASQIAIMACALLCVPHQLRAQDNTSELSQDELDELEQEGFEHYAERRWAEALARWNEVLDHDPARTHLLHFKAQSYFKNGARDTARRYALRAREASPPLKENLAKKNEELLGEIAKLDAQEAEQKRAQMEMRAEQKQIAQAVRPRASNWIWVGTGALALGGISLGGAVWQSNKLVDVREQMKVPQTRPEYDALREVADGHQTLGQVFFLSSVALAATGVGIIVWDLMTPEDDTQEEAAPTQTSFGVTPTGAFVRMSW